MTDLATKVERVKPSGFAALHEEIAGAKHRVPAHERRYPPGCPDGDWCRGNNVCYWNCKGDSDDLHER